MKTAEEWAKELDRPCECVTDPEQGYIQRRRDCDACEAFTISEVQRDAIEAARTALFDAYYQLIEEMPNGPTCDGAQWAVATGCTAIRALIPVRP